MVSCEIITDRKRTPLIGAYLHPSAPEHLLDLKEALPCFRYQDTILLGELYTNTRQSNNPRNQQVADLLMELGLMDLLHRFKKRW